MKITIKAPGKTTVRDILLLQPIERHEAVQVLRNVFTQLNNDQFPKMFHFIPEDMSQINNEDELLIDTENLTVTVNKGVILT